MDDGEVDQKNYDDVDIDTLREGFEFARRGHMVHDCPTQVWREEGSTGGGSDKGKGKGERDTSARAKQAAA